MGMHSNYSDQLAWQQLRSLIINDMHHAGFCEMGQSGLRCSIHATMPVKFSFGRRVAADKFTEK